jgi:DNA-binding transcriptional ArsR family regulator
MNNEKIATILRNQSDEQLIASCDTAMLAALIRLEDDGALLRLVEGVTSRPKPVAPKRRAATRKPKAAPVKVSDDEAIGKVWANLDDCRVPCTAGHIIRDTSLDGPTVSRALKRLEKAGKVISAGTRRGKTYLAVVTATNGTANYVGAQA